MNRISKFTLLLGSALVLISTVLLIFNPGLQNGIDNKQAEHDSLFLYLERVKQDIIRYDIAVSKAASLLTTNQILFAIPVIPDSIKNDFYGKYIGALRDVRVTLELPRSQYKVDSSINAEIYKDGQKFMSNANKATDQKIKVKEELNNLKARQKRLNFWTILFQILGVSILYVSTITKPLVSGKYLEIKKKGLVS